MLSVVQRLLFVFTLLLPLAGLAPVTLEASESTCLECKGGVTELTLKYTGETAALIRIEDGGVVYDIGTVGPDEEFTIAGTESDGKFDHNDL
ncbi:secreted protein, partial [Candidatus Thiomargarita nelsonii]